MGELASWLLIKMGAMDKKNQEFYLTLWGPGKIHSSPWDNWPYEDAHNKQAFEDNL